MEFKELVEKIHKIVEHESGYKGQNYSFNLFEGSAEVAKIYIYWFDQEKLKCDITCSIQAFPMGKKVTYNILCSITDVITSQVSDYTIYFTYVVVGENMLLDLLTEIIPQIVENMNKTAFTKNYTEHYEIIKDIKFGIKKLQSGGSRA